MRSYASLRLLAPTAALALVAGCASSGNHMFTAQGDLAQAGDAASAGRDSGVPLDAAAGGGDLAIGGGDDAAMNSDDAAIAGDDAAAPVDSAVPHDSAAQKDAAMPGKCTVVNAWPGLMPVSDYDPMAMVTFAASANLPNLPFDALTVEDWVTMGEKWPKTVTYMPGDQYATCEVCALIQSCTNMGCNDHYFAQGGTVTVTRADRNPVAGRITATVKNLTLVEWDFSQNGDQPIPNGKCIQIASASFDVPWSHATDGGVADLAKPVEDIAVKGDLRNADLALAPDLAVSPDLAGAADLASGADLRPGPDLVAADLALGCTPVLNEIQTAGASAADEFVELYNPCAAPVDLTGWKLVYRSARNNNGGSDIALYTFAQTIGSHGYLLIGGQSYPGMVDGTESSGLAASGGAVGLRDPLGRLADSVSWSVLTTPNAFTETMPAPNPPASQSLERLPNGIDSNDNSKDFQVTKKPTPRAANQ